MSHPVAALWFGGNCAEAMRFYEKTFGAKMETFLTVKQSPMCDQAPPGTENLVMHACLVFKDGGRLMAADAMMGEPYEGMKGFSAIISYDTVEEAQRIFDALSKGGTITMPAQPAFWAELTGMLTDRFGTPWIVNGILKPV